MTPRARLAWSAVPVGQSENRYGTYPKSEECSEPRWRAGLVVKGVGFAYTEGLECGRGERPTVATKSLLNSRLLIF